MLPLPVAGRTLGIAMQVLLLCWLGLATAAAATDAKGSAAHAQLCKGSEAPLSPEYDARTKDDAAFNAAFAHCFATVRGVQMHAVEGGVHGGPIAIMLHGWPQSWYEFRQLLPAVARTHRVVAIDLPGLGDSTGTPRTMAKATLAHYVFRYVHKREERVARRGVTLIAHDLGVGVAFAYAAKFRHEVHKAV